MIGFRRSASTEHPTATKAAERLSRLPRSEVLLWADNTGSALSRALYTYQRDGDAGHLDDVEQAALMLLGAVRSLRGA